MATKRTVNSRSVAKATKAASTAGSTVSQASHLPWALASIAKRRELSESSLHLYGSHCKCVTDTRGYSTPKNRGPLDLVLDSSEGFIPLWAKRSRLRWRFQDQSLQAFANPNAVKSAIRQLISKALVAWGDAVPIKFAERSDAWDFEIVVNENTDCDVNGCTLASAFFPDSGRHELNVFPTLFEQSEAEQIETLAHELGHVFGLRHFFAQTSETAWPSEIFGRHRKFSIMNYGADSQLTNDDRIDLKKLYQAVWSGQMTEINGTPIRLVRPFHTTNPSGFAVNNENPMDNEPENSLPRRCCCCR